MATVHLVETDGTVCPYDAWDAWVERVTRRFPALPAASHHGDLVEDQAWSGHRAHGVAVVWRRNGRWALEPLATDVDPEGGIPAGFPVGLEFPFHHWHLDAVVVRDWTGEGRTPWLQWHSELGLAPWMPLPATSSSVLHPVEVDPEVARVALASPWSNIVASATGWAVGGTGWVLVWPEGAAEPAEPPRAVVGTRHPQVGLVL